MVSAVFPPTIPPHASLIWKGTSFFVYTIATSSSVYRLWHRFRTRQAWWDDYVLFFPLVLETFYAILFWVSVPQTNGPIPDNIPYALLVLNSYWFTRFIFLIIIWPTRIVLALSLARLFPQRSWPRIWSMFLVMVMALFMTANILISAMTCERKTILLLANEGTDCVRSHIAGIPLEDVFFCVGDIISDTLLVLCPIFWFWNIRLPQKERRLILLAFCGNVLTLLSAITFVLLNRLDLTRNSCDRYLLYAGMAHIVSALSLFVCNFTVVTTGLYRLLRSCRPSESDAESPATSTSREPEHRESSPRDTRPLTQDYTSSSSRYPTPLTLTEISSFWSGEPRAVETRNSNFASPKSSSMHENGSSAVG